jgi:hypothetical protein
MDRTENTNFNNTYVGAYVFASEGIHLPSYGLTVGIYPFSTIPVFKSYVTLFPNPHEPSALCMCVFACMLDYCTRAHVSNYMLQLHQSAIPAELSSNTATGCTCILTSAETKLTAEQIGHMSVTAIGHNEKSCTYKM